MLTVEIYEAAYAMSDTPSPSVTECLLISHIRDHAFQAPASHRVHSGINERYPTARNGCGAFRCGFFQIDRDVGRVEEIVGEVLLNQITLLTSTDDKIIDSVMGINLQNVPQNGLATDFYHGLGRVDVSSLRRLPRPPARITAFIKLL